VIDRLFSRNSSANDLNLAQKKEAMVSSILYFKGEFWKMKRSFSRDDGKGSTLKIRRRPLFSESCWTVFPISSLI